MTTTLTSTLSSLINTDWRVYIAGLALLCVASVLGFTYLGNPFLLDFDKEFSLPSLYHYVLLAACAYGFYRLMLHERAYDALFYAFAYLLIDDIVTLHENAGWLLSMYVIPSEVLFFTKRAIGEFVYLSLVGSVLAVLLFRRFIQASADVRKQILIFIGLIFVFSIFGFLVDSIHERACRSGSAACFWLGIVEDGGEIFVTIFIVHRIRTLLARYCKPQALQGQDSSGRRQQRSL